ncbi:hypothetical protein D0Z00_002647 [Geotrichum galactomycetum]|uniref:Uncharacterized protein n=1 Tax=Geotrichum galactomycetum TaxID=27317 RepID=A0ACB6V3Q9_9ASCO|nr:hypothetical protein D0Z00_002647 [Geotrichum candidum]
MPPSLDQEREQKINEALAAYIAGDPSIRNVALRFGVPRSTLRDRIKRANITKDTQSPQAKRESMLKSRAKVISEKQSKDTKQREREVHIQEALQYYATEEGSKEGLRSLAAKFGIPRSTLRGRILGGSMNPRFRVQKGQKLSLAEEDIIVDCISQLCRAGEEVSLSRVKNMANILQQYRSTSKSGEQTPNQQYQPDQSPFDQQQLEQQQKEKKIPKTIDPETGKVNQVCLGWVRGFLGRHPTLIDAKGRILEAEVVKKLTPQLFKNWFSNLHYQILQQDSINGNTSGIDAIDPGNIYNVDFTKIQVSQTITDGHRQIVSSDCMPFDFWTSPQAEPFGAIECCSAAGTALDPFVIVKAQSSYFVRSEIERAVATFGSSSRWQFRESDDGELTDALVLEWFHSHFDPITTKAAAGANSASSSAGSTTLAATRVLIGDFCECETLKRACQERNIILIGLPKHTAHELQPLDIGVFNKTKRNLCMKIDTFFKSTPSGDSSNFDDSNGLRDISASDLLECFHQARKFGVTKINIQKSFKLAGIVPFDPNTVLERVWEPNSNSIVPYDFAANDDRDTDMDRPISASPQEEQQQPQQQQLQPTSGLSESDHMDTEEEENNKNGSDDNNLMPLTHTYFRREPAPSLPQKHTSSIHLLNNNVLEPPSSKGTLQINSVNNIINPLPLPAHSIPSSTTSNYSRINNGRPDIIFNSHHHHMPHHRNLLMDIAPLQPPPAAGALQVPLPSLASSIGSSTAPPPTGNGNPSGH